MWFELTSNLVFVCITITFILVVSLFIPNRSEILNRMADFTFAKFIYKSTRYLISKLIAILTINSTSTTISITPETILQQSNLMFHRSDGHSKVLVITFSWLFARERHLQKYRKIYLERGYDMLTVKTNVLDVLYPINGSQKIAKNVVHFLEHAHHKYDDILIHAFSIGTYQFGEVLVQWAHNDRSNEVTAKLRGQIFDSGVDVDEALNYFTQEVIRNKPIGFILKWSIMAYVTLFHNLTTKQHRRSSDHIHRNKYRCPTLMFLSSNDTAVNELDQRKFAQYLANNGIPVTIKCWPQSLHVGHFIKFTDEYLQYLNKFIDNVILH